MKAIEKIAILSVSLLTIIATAAIAPALGGIAKAMPSVNPLFIKSIITLPALVCIPVGLTISGLSKRFSKKSIIIVGTILYTVGGVLSGIAPNIYILLLTRVIMGLGLGVLAPLSLAIMGDFFTGNERAKYMGFSSAVSNIGAVIFTYLVGVLTAINWRYAFIVYLVGILVIVIVIIGFPKKPIYEHKIDKNEGHIKLNKEVYKYVLIAFIGFIIFYCVVTNIAILLSSEGIKNATISGLLVSIMTLCAFVIGLFFGRIITTFKKFVPIISFGLMIIGFIILCNKTDIVFLIVAAIFTGIGFGLVVPFTMFSASKCVHLKHIALSVSMITGGIYFGEFVSPIILGILNKLFNFTTKKGSFYSAIILGIIFIIIYILDLIRVSLLNSKKKLETCK